MTPTDMNVQQMMWRPAFIRLTQVGMPHVDEGKPHPLYLDPQAISMIFRNTMQLNNPDGTKQQFQVCTIIQCCHFQVCVEESVEVVAMLRDKALGHESKPKSV